MIQELEERKKELEFELEEIEARFGKRVSTFGSRFTSWIPKGVRSSISSGTSGRSLPLAVAGAAVVIAFSSGWLRGGRQMAATGIKGLLRSSLTGILFSELRRLATKRAMHYVMDQFEQRVGHRESTGSRDVNDPL
ncbi:MAG: hypothetical protein ACQER4_09750 [Bacteroidota bacterium]